VTRSSVAVRAIVVAVAVVLSAAGCAGSTGVAGAAEAKRACATGTPPLPGSAIAAAAAGTPVGHTLSNYQTAQTHSAKAAAENPRWTALNDALGVLVAAWSAAVAVIGPAATTDTTVAPFSDEQLKLSSVMSEWLSKGTDAETTVRSECAVAEAAH
jgi:hypothetical protein